MLSKMATLIAVLLAASVLSLVTNGTLWRSCYALLFRDLAFVFEY